MITNYRNLIEKCVPVVGSSANITDGLAISSQASDRRFFSPPLIPRTFTSPTFDSAQLTLKSSRRKCKPGDYT